MEQSTELKTDVLKHGMRVRLTIDMPDDEYPLYAGDTGTIFDNATLGGSEHWKGFCSDRYKSQDVTHVSRKDANNVTYRVVDFCEPVALTGLNLVLSRLDEAQYALSHVKHHLPLQNDYEALSELCNRTALKVNYWLKSSTKSLKKQLEKLIDGINLSIPYCHMTTLDLEYVALAETYLCEAWELCLDCPPVPESQSILLTRKGFLIVMTQRVSEELHAEVSAIFGDGQ